LNSSRLIGIIGENLQHIKDGDLMISYKPLQKLLIDRDIKKQDLQGRIKVSWSTMAKFSKNQYVSLEVIDKICAELDCQPGDLIEYIPDKHE
jgi:putative transcriptional regulator